MSAQNEHLSNSAFDLSTEEKAEFFSEMNRLSEISGAQKHKIFKQIYADLTAGKKPDPEHKKLLILTGLPGSGKSKAAKKRLKENQDTVNISVDDLYLYHPNIKKLFAQHPVKLNSKEDCYSNFKLYEFADQAFLYVSDKARKEGYSLIVDALLNEELIGFAEKTQKEGYQSEFITMAVPKSRLDLHVFIRHLWGRRDDCETGHPMARMRHSPQDMREIRRSLKLIEDKGFKLSIINVFAGKTIYESGKTKVSAEQAFMSEYLRKENSPEEQAEIDSMCTEIPDLIHGQKNEKFEKQIYQSTIRKLRSR